MSNKIIFLVGVKHTGKSTLGRMLSEHLSRPFLDTDSMMQDLDSSETGMRRPVRDIYADDGRDRFLQLEHTVLELIASREDCPIVATGGGLCDNEAARLEVQHGVTVHLRDSVHRLESRILSHGIPAFLKSHTISEARKELTELLERRISAYELLADVTIDLADRSVSQGLSTLIKTIEELESGRQ